MLRNSVEISSQHTHTYKLTTSYRIDVFYVENCHLSTSTQKCRILFPTKKWFLQTNKKYTHSKKDTILFIEVFKFLFFLNVKRRLFGFQYYFSKVRGIDVRCKHFGVLLLFPLLKYVAFVQNLEKGREEEEIKT